MSDIETKAHDSQTIFFSIAGIASVVGISPATAARRLNALGMVPAGLLVNGRRARLSIFSADQYAVAVALLVKPETGPAPPVPPNPPFA